LLGEAGRKPLLAVGSYISKINLHTVHGDTRRTIRKRRCEVEDCKEVEKECEEVKEECAEVEAL
jgi:hypothetical protein